jgi:hypothetical protein
MAIMPLMRPAAGSDRAAVKSTITARCDRLEELGLPSWRPSLNDLVAPTDTPYRGVWVLEGLARVKRSSCESAGPGEPSSEVQPGRLDGVDRNIR